MDLLQLADRMDKFAASIPEAASNAAVEVALAIVKDLAVKTPVDTSQAISNWIVTLGNPSSNKIPPHFPGEQGSTFFESSEETIAEAYNVLDEKQPGQDIYITNNQDYIIKLNEGSSRQQPAGFVERAVLIGRKISSNVKITV